MKRVILGLSGAIAAVSMVAGIWNRESYATALISVSLLSFAVFSFTLIYTNK